MPSFTDTHCHIHEAAGSGAVAERWQRAGLTDPAALLRNARAAGVDRLICVGCTLRDSKLAVEFAAEHDGVWASIGIHPHEAKEYDDAALQEFAALLTSGREFQPAVSRGSAGPPLPLLRHRSHMLANSPGDLVGPALPVSGKAGRGGVPYTEKIIAIGECGLDYFYEHSPKVTQEKILRLQIELALQHNLPLIFHVREAFGDFWRIFDEYIGIRGVVHSFTAGQQELEQILARGLYVGQNGIMTFTKHVTQLDAAKAVPADKILLETDAPFLTPQPLRGTINEPKYVALVAAFLAELRGESLDQLAENTTRNAQQLFGIS